MARLLAVLAAGESLKASALMQCLGLRDRPKFRALDLLPALALGLLGMSEPD